MGDVHRNVWNEETNDGVLWEENEGKAANENGEREGAEAGGEEKKRSWGKVEEYRVMELGTKQGDEQSEMDVWRLHTIG